MKQVELETRALTEALLTACLEVTNDPIVRLAAVSGLLVRLLAQAYAVDPELVERVLSGVHEELEPLVNEQVH